MKKTYSKLSSLPSGEAPECRIDGCLVLEGGAWRGLYTQGVLDALMQHGICMQTTIGTSAGALSAIGYLSGQIGLTVRINLTYRGDKNYCGIGAMKREHSITGFSYLFRDITKEYPINRKRWKDPSRRLVVTATNMITGEQEYFEKGKDQILRAIQASATVPFISRPVVINRVPYLDGGCSGKIPYDWAVEHGYEKIIVVRTQDRSYRRETKKVSMMDRLIYGRYPAFVQAMIRANNEYNAHVERIEQKESEGRCYVIAPSRPVGIRRFEGDVEKLGELYYLGYEDTLGQMDEIKSYVGKQ